MSELHDAARENRGSADPEHRDVPAASPAERSLLDRLKVRDDEAFTRELAACEDRTRRLIGVLVRDPDDAKDVYCEAVFTAYEKRWQFVFGGGSFAAWLQKIALYKISEQYRRQKARQSTADVETSQDQLATPSPGDRVVIQEEAAEIALALGKLPPKQFVVIQMHYFFDCSVGDISRQLGIAENAVSKRLERGRRFLERRLAKRGVFKALSAEDRLAVAEALSADEGLHQRRLVGLQKKGDSS